MRLGILLLFIAVPLIELALLIKIGEQIGVIATIGLVIITAVVGTWVLQQQGLRTMYRLQESMARGEPPIEPVVDGMFLLMAGGFLLTPGILTDAVGFLLLVPAVRRTIAKWGLAKLLTAGKVHVTTFGTGGDGGARHAETDGHTAHHGARKPSPNPATSKKGDGPVIDGEFERIDENERPPKRN